MKFKAILGAAVVLGAMMLATVSASAATTYKAGAVKGSKGNTVNVPITAVSSDGTDYINGYIIQLEYDATQVEVQQNQNEDDPAGGSLYAAAGSTFGDGVFVADRLTEGQGGTTEHLAVAWASASNHKVATTDEALANVSFLVKSNATASSIPVKVTVLQVATDPETLKTNINGVAGKIDLASIIYGDVTGDGKVMINDAAKVAQAVGKTITLTEEEAIAADVSGDGKIQINDAGLIAQFVGKTITSFPVENK